MSLTVSPLIPTTQMLLPSSVRLRSLVLSQPSRRFFSPPRPCSMRVVAQDETRCTRPKGVGVDLNRGFVYRARAHGPVFIGDLRALTVSAASFDAVWASASLIHMPNEDAAVALGEFARVARMGAPISVSVKTGGVTGWADDTPMGRRWFSIWTPGDFAGAVEMAGLSIDGVFDDGQWMEVRARR